MALEKASTALVHSLRTPALYLTFENGTGTPSGRVRKKNYETHAAVQVVIKCK
jgi:hypothetical protein